MKKGTCERSIFIDIHEWFDRLNGNTYFSAVVSVDGEWQFTTGMQYGYGDHALYECAEGLATLGFVTELNEHQAFSRQARDAGIDFYYARRDVLKRDLPKPESRWERSYSQGERATTGRDRRTELAETPRGVRVT